LNREQEFLAKIEQHKGVIYKVSRMYMEQPDDQEDLFQEIVLQLWKSYDNFRGDSQFSTWMYRVAINTAMVFFKKEKSRKQYYSDTKDPEIAAEEYNPVKESQLDYFYQAVQELNKVEKALIFFFLQGQSHKEIAGNLGLTEVNARVKLNRTKEKLQQIIKDRGYEF
jgi:RNA polymerase sigma factor (sigma-70 family)